MIEESERRREPWSRHFDAIDMEIAQLALVCQVPLLDPGVIERVLHSDTLVCGHQNARAFAKLRTLLMMHYSVREKAVVALGQEETLELVGDIISRLRDRVGNRLGGPRRRPKAPAGAGATDGAASAAMIRPPSRR